MTERLRLSDNGASPLTSYPTVGLDDVAMYEEAGKIAGVLVVPVHLRRQPGKVRILTIASTHEKREKYKAEVSRLKKQ